MNISELIKKLEQFKDEHGDLEVSVCGKFDIEVKQGWLFTEDEDKKVCFISDKH